MADLARDLLMGLKDDAGILLKHARLAKGLTLRELSDASGVNYRTISAIENGSNTTLETMETLLGVLEVEASITRADEQARWQQIQAIRDRLDALLPRLSQHQLDVLLQEVSILEKDAQLEAPQ